MGGVGQIPFPSLAKYCETYGIQSLEDQDWFFRLMKMLDRVFMDYQAKKIESKETSPP